MNELKEWEYAKLFQTTINGVQVVLSQYQKYFDEHLNNVKLDIGNIMQDNENIKEVFQQFNYTQQQTASGEGDFMNNTIAELKEKTTNIDGIVRNLEKEVAVIQKTLDIRLTTIDSSLNAIKETISNLSNPVLEMQKTSVEHGKDIQYIKEKVSDTITNNKWLFTTIIASLGLIVSAIKLFF